MTYRQPDPDLSAEQAARQKRLDDEVARFKAAVRKSPVVAPARVWRDLGSPAGRALRWHQLLHAPGCVTFPLLALPAVFAGCYTAGALYDSPGDFAGALGSVVYATLGGAIGLCVAGAVYALLRRSRQRQR